MALGLSSIVPVEDIAAGARFLRRLPSFLRHPIGSEEARAIVRRRLERREADFLAVAERLIYRHDDSPYRDLLRLAGCEYGDLERLVGREGVEGALRVLYRQGVYLTIDEFKGRRPAVRGSATVSVDPARLCNPGATVHALAQSSGSRGPRTRVPLDLASNWDHAVVVERARGCPLEHLGWLTHLHTIRSFEKLTGEGMTFFDTDVIRVLEEVLLARFGGAPTDYQLSEEEAEDGRSHLRLLVHPDVGPMDEAAVVNQFLTSIGGGSDAERVMELVWRQAGLVSVVRRAPHAQASGKILHLHLERGGVAPAERPTVSAVAQ